MALVVLLRGANLGKRRFSPKALVAEQLPWEDPEMAVLKEKEVRDALAAGAEVDVPAGAKRFAIALPRAPSKTPSFPLEAMAKDGGWGMRYEGLAGRVLLGVRRRFDETGSYSTKEIDAAVGAERGTMRDWPTWERIGAALDAA